MDAKYAIQSINTDKTGTVRLISFTITFTDPNLPGVECLHAGILEIGAGLTADASMEELVAAVKSAMDPLQLANIEQFAANTLHYDYLQKNTTAIDKGDPAPVVYPNLSAREIRLVLVRNGYSLSSVDAAIAALPDGQEKDEASIEWEYATEFERYSPTLLAIAGALAIGSEKIDAMWLQA